MELLHTVLTSPLFPLVAAFFLAVPAFAVKKRRLGARAALRFNLGIFGLMLLLSLLLPLSGYAFAGEVSSSADVEAAVAGSYSWAYIAAALATGLGSIGAGIAVAAAAPAAIGALAENDSTFGKAVIFVGLGEGLAIFGLLVSILILQKVP